MQNVDINMCEKFHYNRLRNDRALGTGKSGNKKNNVRGAWRPVFRSKNSVRRPFDLCGIQWHSPVLHIYQYEMLFIAE